MAFDHVKEIRNLSHRLEALIASCQLAPPSSSVSDTSSRISERERAVSGCRPIGGAASERSNRADSVDTPQPGQHAGALGSLSGRKNNLAASAFGLLNVIVSSPKELFEREALRDELAAAVRAATPPRHTRERASARQRARSSYTTPNEHEHHLVRNDASACIGAGLRRGA
jgi:hypothetical protein